MCTGTAMFNLIFFIPVSHLINHQPPVIVKHSAVLTCNSSCSGNIRWTFSTRPEMLVRECKTDKCVEGPGFRNRTRLVQGNPSLRLDPVMYSDNGWYVCHCNGTEICQFHLEVVFPYQKRVCVGDTVAIPCYASTDKGVADNDIKVQWKKDGKVIANLQHGIIRGRGLIMANQYRNGDLSLSIHKVQQSDEGVYGCTHRHEEHGIPQTTALQVTECNAAVQFEPLPQWGNLVLVFYLWTFLYIL